MEKQKIIFLDIDGVLINEYSMKHVKDSDVWPKTFDPACVAELNRLVRETGAKVVISSAWRLHLDMDVLAEIFRLQNVLVEIIDETEELSMFIDAASRRREIEKWLKNNQEKVHNYLVIDDLPLRGFLRQNQVLTKFEPGLTSADADKGIAILNQGSVK